MNKFVFIFLLALSFCSCINSQTQNVADNKLIPSSTSGNVNNVGEIGYPRFTTSDTQYLGCWRSIEASEVVEYELKFFRLTENAIQTSKMSKPIVYSEVDSNNYKDYFVLRTESENNDIQPYLSINMVTNDEMTIHEFATKEEITHGEGVNYWNLQREDCEKISNKFKK